VAGATVDPARDARGPIFPARPAGSTLPQSQERGGDARALMLRRRSAVAFDGRSHLEAAGFTRILARTLPAGGAPWDALWWSSRVHLVVFVHRINGIAP